MSLSFNDIDHTIRLVNKNMGGMSILYDFDDLVNEGWLVILEKDGRDINKAYVGARARGHSIEIIRRANGYSKARGELWEWRNRLKELIGTQVEQKVDEPWLFDLLDDSRGSQMVVDRYKYDMKMDDIAAKYGVTYKCVYTNIRDKLKWMRKKLTA